MQTAMEWGVAPMQFDSRTSDEKAEMIAMCQAKSLVEAWHYEASEKSAKQSDTFRARGMK